MTVEHDPKSHKFFVVLGGEEAVLEYELDGSIINFYHTFVPNSARGKGVAEKLVKAGFEYARSNQLKVIPSCPYISQTFLNRYQEYRLLVKT